jgi:hypothetical protein
MNPLIVPSIGIFDNDKGFNHKNDISLYVQVLSREFRTCGTPESSKNGNGSDDHPLNCTDSRGSLLKIAEISQPIKPITLW